MKSIQGNRSELRQKENREISGLDELSEAEIEVYGRVQGVNFRNTIKGKAQDMGLKGYVRNLENGYVLIVSQGEKNKIQELIAWAKSSPGFSSVDSVQCQWKKAKVKYQGFEIMGESSLLVDQAKSFLNLGKRLVENKQKIPRHVSIIPDGNRRWAWEKGLHASYGHYTAGSYEHIFELFHEAMNMGVKYFSLWGFSTENWNRSDEEIKAIFDLILNGMDKMREEFHKHSIRFRHIGRRDRLPKNLVKELEKLEDETSDYRDFNVQLCLDYGGRDEIVRAVNKMLKSGIKEINEETFKSYLDTADIPDPDLIIRTSGEKRTSGIMPFQAAYAELHFCDVYFPEFDAFELRKAIKSFGKRIRRFGGTAKEDLK